MAKDARGNAAGEKTGGERGMGVVSFGWGLRTCGGLLARGVLGDRRGYSTSLGILWRSMSQGRMGIRGSTHLIKHIVCLPAPHVGRRPPLVYLAGNYSVEFDRRRTPTRSGRTVRGPVLRSSGNRAMEPLPGRAARIPPLSPVTKCWSDVWIIDKLVWL